MGDKQGKQPISGPILDKIGQPITPGCIIVYGHALGRCAGLRLGKVLKVSGTTEEIHYQDAPKTVRFEYRISVWGLDDDWLDPNDPERVTRRLGEERKAKLLEKRSTLQFATRVLVIDINSLSKEVQDLFNSVEE